MRRLSWTNLLRTTLLAAGISLGAGAMLAPSILQSTLVAAEDSPKKPTTKPGADVPDVDALIKSAVGEALKDAGLEGKKPAKAAAKVTATDKDAVSVPVPENAKKVSKSSNSQMQIEFPAGKGVAAAEIIREQLLAAEWESDDSEPLRKPAGSLTFEKAGKTLVLTYVDPGFGDAKVILMGGGGLKLEQGEVDPKAKVPAAGSRPKPEPKPAPKPDNTPVAANANSGTFVIRGKTYKLEHVMAYESKNGDEERITILASDLKIPVDEVSKNLREKDRSDLSLFIQQSNIRFDFSRTGKPIACRGMGDNYQFGGFGKLTGELKLDAGRARGQVTFTTTKDDERILEFKSNCELTFDVVVGADPVQKAAAAPAGPDKPKTGTTKLPADAKKLETSGTLQVNDKPVKLGNVVAYELMISGKKATAINFTDKPIPLPKLKAQLAKDGSDMGLFDFDSQAKLEFNQEGKLNVIFVAHDNNSFPIFGSNAISDVVIEDGRARGTVKLGEPKKFAGKSYSVDLTFDVEVLKLPATNEK